jgi:hypothetical protein
MTTARNGIALCLQALVLVVLVVLATAPAAAQSAMPRARTNHAAALLPDGRVMIVGGEDVDRSYARGEGARGTVLRSSVLYDPAHGTWTRAGSLATERTHARAIVLRDGRVVVVTGGRGLLHLEPTIELWSPAASSVRGGHWRSAGALVEARYDASTTLLDDGRILVAGGRNAAGAYLASVEIWDPATEQSVPAASLPIALAAHAAVVLADGRVLVAGGANDHAASARAFAWDPTGDRWTEVGPMTGARAGVSGVRLADGRVLVVGNRAEHAHTTCTDDCRVIEGDVADVFDPRTQRFTATGATGQPHLGEHRLALLADGRVGVFGAFDADRNPARVVEIWAPSTGRFEDWGDSDLAGPTGMTGTELPDGRVLLVGARMEATPRGMRAATTFSVWDPTLARRRPIPRTSEVRPAVLE